VRHEFNDYAVWRKAYNEFDKPRRNLGVIAQGVYRSTENPNEITVTHDFKSMEQARAFIASPDLKAAMEKAGVKGATLIWPIWLKPAIMSDPSGFARKLWKSAPAFFATVASAAGFAQTKRLSLAAHHGHLLARKPQKNAPPSGSGGRSESNQIACLYLRVRDS
jgi:hypothetical protein